MFLLINVLSALAVNSDVLTNDDVTYLGTQVLRQGVNNTVSVWHRILGH